MSKVDTIKVDTIIAAACALVCHYCDMVPPPTNDTPPSEMTRLVTALLTAIESD